MIKPVLMLSFVLALVACGKPQTGSEAGKAIAEQIQRSKARAIEVEKQQTQAAEEARKQIDEAGQ